MPAVEQLPPDLHRFAFINAAPVDAGRDYRIHMERLFDAIDSKLATVGKTPTRALKPKAGETPERIPEQSVDTSLEAQWPTLPEFVDEKDTDDTIYPAGAERSLVERIEGFAKRRGPMELSVGAIIGGFLLSLLSQSFGLGWLTYDAGADGGKQVGFLFAPNWTIVYMILFPPYLAVFALFIGRAHLALRDFCEKGILIGPDGKLVHPNTILLRWNRTLKEVSKIFWIVLVAVVLQTCSEWLMFCCLPLLRHAIGDAGVDWTKLAIVQPEKASWWSAMIFSGLAYAYMGLALFVYLAVLLYVAAFANFLNRLAYHTKQYRLVLRSTVLGEHLSALATQIYACVILGIAAAICMRAQAEYIKSDHAVITDLLFSDLRTAIPWLHNAKTTATPPKPVHIPSEWTSFGEMVFTLLVLFLCIYLMSDAFEKAKKYYLDNINNSNWRKNAGITLVGSEIESVRRSSFVRSVIPRHRQFSVILIGEVLTYLFIGYGVIGLATILYALFQFIIVPAMERRRQTSDSDLDAALPGASFDSPSLVREHGRPAREDPA